MWAKHKAQRMCILKTDQNISSFTMGKGEFSGFHSETKRWESDICCYICEGLSNVSYFPSSTLTFAKLFTAVLPISKRSHIPSIPH